MKNILIGIVIGAVLTFVMPVMAATFDSYEFGMIQDGFVGLREAMRGQAEATKRLCEATYITSGQGDQMSRCGQ